MLRDGHPNPAQLHLRPALYYNYDDKALCSQLAEDLLARTADLPSANGQIQWSIETQSYAFASRVLANLALEKGDRAGWCAYLNSAISRLGIGDRECRTRAVMLLEDLKAELLKWGDVGGRQRLEQRRLELLSTGRHDIAQPLYCEPVILPRRISSTVSKFGRGFLSLGRTSCFING